MSDLLYTSNDWTYDDLERIWDHIDHVARTEYKLDYYPPQMEVVTFNQMIEAYSNIGLPVNYSHWSFGKSYQETLESYKNGKRGLAYELIINSDPAIAYLLDTNTSTTMAMVMAHACVGHSTVFKTNYLMSELSSPKFIVPFCKYAQTRITEIESIYGCDVVENLLDTLHTLEQYGIDESRRVNHKESVLKDRDQSRIVDEQKNFDLIFNKIPKEPQVFDNELNFEIKKIHNFPEKNILYFLENHSPYFNKFPELKEICYIVRKIAQYFYPQRKTKLINEGVASFWHYELMNNLYNNNKISDGNYLEFIDLHSGVINQPSYKKMIGLNPYKVGFAILQDIKRICIQQNDEDLYYFPYLRGAYWLDVIKEITVLYRDESFLQQWLTPRVVKDLKLFMFNYSTNNNFYTITNDQSEECFFDLREQISKYYSNINSTPIIEIVNYKNHGTTELKLKHTRYNKRDLTNIDEFIGALTSLMKCNISFNIYNDKGKLRNEISYKIERK